MLKNNVTLINIYFYGIIFLVIIRYCIKHDWSFMIFPTNFSQEVIIQQCYRCIDISGNVCRYTALDIFIFPVICLFPTYRTVRFSFSFLHFVQYNNTQRNFLFPTYRTVQKVVFFFLFFLAGLQKRIILSHSRVVCSSGSFFLIHPCR